MYFLILYLEIVVFQHEYTEFIEYLCGKLSQNVMKWGTNARDSSLTSDDFLVLTPSFPPWLQWRSAEQEHREQSPLPATRWRMAADFRITVLRYLSPGGQNPPGAALTWRVTRDIASRTRAHVSNSSEREQENQSWFLERKKIARNTIFGYFKCIYI